MLKISQIEHNSFYLNTQGMHVHTKHNVGALVVFNMLLIRVHLGPRLAKLICVHLSMATFMKFYR